MPELGEDELDLEIEEIGDEDEVAISYDIATYPSDFTLSVISEMWKAGDITIPDFQREFVWKIKQSSLLIDSFLRGLPVPPVFFYVGDDNENIVIDGQQRILSVIYFIEGYFGDEGAHGRRQVFRLKGLGEQSPYNNKRFQDLSLTDQRKLRQSVLRAVNIKQLKPSDDTSAYHIFERLNTGGTPLTPQEIRNCVFRGAFSSRLKDANKNQTWRAILGKSNLDRHQTDVEILLRVFALMDASSAYEKPMKEFLNKSMKANRSGQTPKAKKFFARLPKILELVASSLPPRPFHLRGPLNASALDSVMCVLMENPTKVSSSKLKAGFRRLVADEKFQSYTKKATTDPKVVLERLNRVRHFLLN